MIRTLSPSIYVLPVERAKNLIQRYTGGKINHYEVQPYSMAHWYGIHLDELEPDEDDGVDIHISKSHTYGMRLWYNSLATNVDYGVLYALGIFCLDFIPWNSEIKLYKWGNLLDSSQHIACTLFAEEMLKSCTNQQYSTERGIINGI